MEQQPERALRPRSKRRAVKLFAGMLVSCAGVISGAVGFVSDYRAAKQADAYTDALRADGSASTASVLRELEEAHTRNQITDVTLAVSSLMLGLTIAGVLPVMGRREEVSPESPRQMMQVAEVWERL